MVRRYLWIAFLVGTACCSCANEVETGDILEFSSMDGEQVVELYAEEVEILWATKFDTSLILNYDGDSIGLRDMLTPQISDTVPDSSVLVLMVQSVFHGNEDEPIMYLYAQFESGHLTGVYHFDIGHGRSMWKAVDTYAAVVQDDWYRLRLHAVLESIGCGLSSCIRFPYNDDSHDDANHRHQRVYAWLVIPEGFFKLLGKAAEPPEKPLRREPSDSSQAGKLN